MWKHLKICSRVSRTSTLLRSPLYGLRSYSHLIHSSGQTLNTASFRQSSASIRSFSTSKEPPQAEVSEVLRVDACEDTGVITLTLNRPRQRNALSSALLLELKRVLELLKRDGCSEYRAIVIQAEGPVFSSGHDLKEMMSPENNNEERHRELFSLCSEVMMLIEEVPQPVITAVHGIATAAGCQLVAASDLVVSASTARFATPGVSIGLFCSTPAVSLARAVGQKAAMDMLLTGRLVGAQEAQQMGLISRIAESDSQDADAEKSAAQSLAQEIAVQIAARSGTALSIGKKTFKQQIGLTTRAAYDVASDAMVTNVCTPDAGEGISAFIEKRTPTWTHRLH